MSRQPVYVKRRGNGWLYNLVMVAILVMFALLAATMLGIDVNGYASRFIGGNAQAPTVYTVQEPLTQPAGPAPRAAVPSTSPGQPAAWPTAPPQGVQGAAVQAAPVVVPTSEPVAPPPTATAILAAVEQPVVVPQPAAATATATPEYDDPAFHSDGSLGQGDKVYDDPGHDSSGSIGGG